MAEIRGVPMPRTVKIVVALLGIAVPLGLTMAVASAVSSSHATAATAALGQADLTEGRELAATVQTALHFDEVTGAACAVLLGVLAVLLWRPRRRIRAVAWLVSFAALLGIFMAIGEDPSSSIAAGGFSNPHVQHVANRLLPWWYSWIVQLSEFSLLCVLVAVLILLLGSGAQGFYEQGRLTEGDAMWSFVDKRVNESP